MELGERFNQLNWDGIHDNIDLDDALDYFVTKVNGVLEDLLTERTIKVKICKSQPWFWKYKQLLQPEAYKVARNKYFRLIHAIRKSYYQEEFVKHKGDSKALYNLVSRLTGTENTNILTDQPRGIELAEEFAEFFLQKIEKIQSALDGYNHIGKITN